MQLAVQMYKNDSLGSITVAVVGLPSTQLPCSCCLHCTLLGKQPLVTTSNKALAGCHLLQSGCGSLSGRVWSMAPTILGHHRCVEARRTTTLKLKFTYHLLR
jgi:hypothetical protein